MKNENLYRGILIKNTISLVSEYGFEKATTKAIVGNNGSDSDARINEAYIYRIFESKENLFAEIFSLLDNELISLFRENLYVFDGNGDFREKSKLIFYRLWQFLLQNEEKCRYYTRFYYSSYLKGNVLELHKKKFEVLADIIRPVFVDGADVWSLFHNVIAALLNFSTLVYNGAIEDTEDNAEHIFNVTYSSIETYIK